MLDFEMAMMGWLCGIPTLSGMAEPCNAFKKQFIYNPTTIGHAEALLNTDFDRIGCAWSDQTAAAWFCDLQGPVPK